MGTYPIQDNQGITASSSTTASSIAAGASIKGPPYSVTDIDATLYKSGSLYYGHYASDLGLTDPTPNANADTVLSSLASNLTTGGIIKFRGKGTTYTFAADLTLLSFQNLCLLGYGATITGGRIIFDGSAGNNRFNKVEGITFGTSSGIRLQGGSFLNKIWNSVFGNSVAGYPLIGIEIQNGSANAAGAGFNEAVQILYNQMTCQTNNIWIRAPLSTGTGSYDELLIRGNQLNNYNTTLPVDNVLIEAGDGTHSNPQFFGTSFDSNNIWFSPASTSTALNGLHIGATPAGGSGAGQVSLGNFWIGPNKWENDGGASTAYSALFPIYIDVLTAGGSSGQSVTIGSALSADLPAQSLVGDFVYQNYGVLATKVPQLINDAATTNQRAWIFGKGGSYGVSATVAPSATLNTYGTETPLVQGLYPSKSISVVGLTSCGVTIANIGSETITVNFTIYYADGYSQVMTGLTFTTNSTNPTYWQPFIANTFRTCPISMVTAKTKSSINSSSATVTCWAQSAI